jgi:hypothetical protein
MKLSKKTVVDPVCGMEVDPCNTDLTADYEDTQDALRHLKKILPNIRAGSLSKKKESGEDIWTD